MNHWMVLAATLLCFLASAASADDRDAISVLENSGAVIQRDESQKDKPVILVTYNLRQVTAEGNRALKEIEELPSIELMGSGDTELTSATLRALQGKSSLKKLAIAHAKISDESARILGTLKGLDVLEFRSQVEMTPRGLDEVFNLSNLKELTLSDRLVSDRAMEDLPKLSGLKVLSLRSIFVTDEGISSVRRLKNLRTLRIFLSSRVSDEGLRQLSEIRLNDLDITYVEVNNAKLKELRKLSGLKTLHMISAVKVTDEGIPFLSELTELKELDLSDAKLTMAGIKELKKALPNCKVVHDARKRD